MMSSSAVRKPTGAGAAAVLAASIGTFTIGLMTSLAAASAKLNTALAWKSAVGPLSGKTGVGVLTWLVAWVVLHTLWKDRNVNFGRAFTWAIVLIVLGFLLTFPPVFEAFGE